MNKLALFGIVFLLFSSFAAAQEISNQSLAVFEKINQYNLQLAHENAVKITFLVAFLAGILSLFAPCILPFLPAFFAYTFKEKKSITKMTFMFFLGFATSFTILGVLAGVLGQQTLNFIPHRSLLIGIAGVLIVIFGLFTLFGKSFYFRQPNIKTKNDALGVYLFGLLFAVGWVACLGPVLGAILSIGALLHNYLQAGLLLLTYAFGVAVPLFILAFFFDRLHVHALKFMKKEIKIGRFKTLLPSLISGLLLIFTGLFFLFFEGTDFVNSITFFGFKEKFYDWQRALVNWPYANVLGLVALIAFIVLISYFWRHRDRTD